MTTLFIILSLFGAACTFNLYFPAYRRFPLSVISFIAGVLVGELAFIFLALQIVGTLFFILAGAVTGLFATLALFITGISWLGLLAHIILSFHSADDLEQKINALTGIDNNPEPDSPTTFRLVPPQFSPELWQRVRRPFKIRLPGVRFRRDIVYAEADGLALKLDLYTPRQTVTNAPVLLYIHGGGLLENAGTKHGQGLPLLNEMANRGWVAVSVDYRLSPSFKWPAHLADCKAALRWIRKNISDYGGDPDFVITAGDSAGGQLSAMMAVTGNNPTDSSPAHEAEPASDEDSRVQGAICYYGVMDFGNLHGHQHNGDVVGQWADMVVGEQDNPDRRQALLASASAITQVKPDSAPCLVLHGDKDSLVSVAESRRFVQELEKISHNLVIYAEIPGAQHGFNMMRSIRGELVLLQVYRFADCLHRRYLAGKDSKTE